jgi:ATP-binding cassette subfamily B protein
MESIKWISGYVKKYKLTFVFAMLLVLVDSALNMVNPYFSGVIVDSVIQKNNKKILIPILLTMILVTVIKSFVKYFYQFSFEKISQNSIYEIRNEMFTKLQALDSQFYSENRTGDLMSRMTGDMESVRHFLSWVIYNVFENLSIFIFSVGFMFYINWKFALIMIATTPLVGYLAFKMTLEVGPTFYNIREQLSKLNTIVQENISGNRVVKSFAKEDFEIEKFTKENKGFYKANIESAAVWEKYLPILDSLAGFFLVEMTFFGGILVIKNMMSLGDLVVFNSLIWAINNPMRMAGWLINDIERFIAGSKKIRMLLMTEPKIKNNKDMLSIEKIKGEIQFNNVSFSFKGKDILKDITFKVKPGQTLGIIGPTGSGKSTLINLLERFYDTTSGKILLDGKKIKDYDYRIVRDNIAVAMQDVFLFSDTVKQNISYGTKFSEEHHVFETAKAACAHEFISKMSDGYETIVGERGVGLSGGQKQRIALARAIIKNTPILVLDDTTSALDMETEYEIQKNLKAICKEKTCIIIANRISSVKNADIIIVLKDGIIEEIGKHEQLLLNKNYYYNVYLNQWGDFDLNIKKEVI